MAYSQCTIWSSDRWTVESFGSGDAFSMRKHEKHGDRVVFFQGGDAVIFQDKLEEYEQNFPEKHYDWLFRRLWEDEQYDLIAETEL